ncbi:MAG: GNAT family N-acetyltransferase, partial [Cyclobacteriaceae bacterium]|nr:GNAT family N-acetyltransferase [Cyclobacteriaceae bacterium HetDA_MAG_MS6]
MRSAKFRIEKATSDELRKKAFAIREEVFVVEQQVSRLEEFDEFEDRCIHFVALDVEQQAIGAARWRETQKGIKLERFAVKKSWRGQGLGSALVDAVLKDIHSTMGAGRQLYLHAQLDAVPLYEKFDFKTVGDQFEECKI